MNTVRSQDGTRIAYDRAGKGRALILVDGALCYRDSGPSGLPNATHRVVAGQTHMLKPQAIAPILIEFFGA